MSKPTYVITPTQFSVHIKGDNPVFGESVTTVSLGDEDAGGFVLLHSNDESCEKGEVRLDYDELEMILKAVNQLRKQET